MFDYYAQPMSMQIDLAEKEKEHYRTIADYETEVMPIWQLLLNLDMDAFAKKFSDRWHKPYKPWIKVATWDKRNRHRYVRCLHASKTVRSGYEELKWHRKYWYKALMHIVENDILLVTDKKHFWANQLRSISMHLKHDVGLDAAQRGTNYLSLEGLYSKSGVPEWRKSNVIARIKEFKGGQFLRNSHERWDHMGQLWAYIDLFRLAWEKFHEFERATTISGAEIVVETAHQNSTPAAVPLTLRQVALLHIFAKKPAIKRDSRADAIARAEGHTSGPKLYDHYRKLSKKTGITGMEGDELPSMINDIEVVLLRLDAAHQQGAKDALEVLRAKEGKI
ncbi:hypothetical protein [Hymenobacter sp. BT491]|uniref:hypothetical protein n=1 Tax=Hymenobacter sp. BT491 TaxID=2766779 RepID=UPI0016536D8A|nr:hypothetical protein [Hymenobacter sp. BT491]MBC6991678.1 hypothetical protein [Hymenobacter sp. BT491]